VDKFATKSDAERRDVFRETASRRGVSTIIMEKDFWVCWTLKRLFENSDLAPHITFKGGTSLSKAYHLIERFSEDVDLTISHHALHLVEGKSPMEEGISSGKELRRRIDALKQKAQFYVANNILPALEADIRIALGETNAWQLTLDVEDRDQQTILFHYPKNFSYGVGAHGVGGYGIGMGYGVAGAYRSGVAGYIKPTIKLEFGARGETEPSSTENISPYVVEAFPDLFTEKTCAVPTLSAERSFWEKATILHALCHGARIRDRMSRHYYDTYRMDQKGVTAKALDDIDLLERVVRNKSLFFRDTKASYETAKIGSLRFIPDNEVLKALKKDYADMSEMLMGEYPTFDTIINGLAALETRINSFK
jgi:predicted nucleotidyltransferase component of viral defense system